MSKQGRGIVFLVGGGPGADDLITVKGLRCLQRADVVLHDDLVGETLLRQLPPDVERIYVGKRGGYKALTQQEVCELLVQHARQGKRVVRLKGGDPYVLGRGGEEAQALARAGVPFQVVPGVSAALAVPAYAGIPLTHRDCADGFEVFTGHGVPGDLTRRTLVVLMGMRRLAENVEHILQRGYPPDLPAAVIRWGTVPRQRTIVSTLGRIAEEAGHVESPAILVVGKVVELRRQLSWYEGGPLFGLRVLVTRARHQAVETCRLLEDLGAMAVELPTIAIKPLDPAPLVEALGRIDGYDFLILTSANTLEPMRRAMATMGLDSRALAGLTICAIGPGTADALAAIGIRPDLVPEREHQAEGILELLPPELIRGKRVLLPRAASARAILPRVLEERGAEVDLIPVYETALPEPALYREGLARLERGEVDVLSFTSASTVENFATIVGPRQKELCADKLVVAIGPITRDACERVGLHVDVMPATFTLPAMVDALVQRITASRASKGEDNDAVP